MKKINMKRVKEITGDYREHLVSSLKNKKSALTYLQVALEEYQKDDDREAFMLSLRHVAMAQGGIAHLANETNLNRESLYRLLSGKGNPTIETLITIFHALGIRIKLEMA